MAQLIKAVIDTQKNSYRSIGQVNAADDLELELEVKMNGQPIEFINPECELLIKKSDNNKVRQTKDIIYQDGKFKIKVDEQGVTCTGIVVNQLTINDGGRISTCLFYFMVATSLDGEILKSISKVEVLEQLEEYIVTAFANLKDFEEKVLSSDETIRKLNYDMNESEKIRDTAELQRQETFKSLKENMNEAITNLESSINLSNMNEKERSEVFNSLKSNLESIKQDLINLNASVESEEEKRVQAEINRVNKALEIIEKLESTNNSVATAEAERVSEFNKIKTENNTLKEALTTINNTANSNEEVRKENETSRVEAEKARVNEFNTMKLENETFKQEINEQYAYFIALGTNDAYKKPYQLGTINDVAGTDSFVGYYKQIIENVRLNAPNSVIFCCSRYSKNDSDGYNAMIKSITELYNGVFFVDIANESDITLDIGGEFVNGSHFTTLGYARLAENIMRIVSNIILNNISYFKFFLLNNDSEEKYQA